MLEVTEVGPFQQHIFIHVLHRAIPVYKADPHMIKCRGACCYADPMPDHCGELEVLASAGALGSRNLSCFA